MLELYNAPQSTCSQKVRICLAEKELEWVDRRINLGANEQLRPEYLKLNPNGVVPTLVHDGSTVLDSSVICEYLEDAFPQVPLTPSDPVERARMRTWMRFLEEVPTPAIRVPTFHMALGQRFRSLDREQFRSEQADVRPLRKHFYRRMGPEGFAPEDVVVALEQLDLTLRRMEEALADGPWLMGAAYTLADIVVVPTIDRLADLGLSAMWEGRYPRVKDWYARFKDRPAFQAAYYPGSRLSEFLKIKPLDVPLPLAS